MRHRTARRIVTSLVALATAAVVAAPAAATTRSDHPHSSKRSHTRVLANCVTPKAKPIRIILACADENALVSHLHYSAYGASRATGYGRYVHNDCTPDCASGHFHHYPVTILLSRARTRHGVKLFTRLTTTDRKGVQQVFDLPTRKA